MASAIIDRLCVCMLLVLELLIGRLPICLSLKKKKYAIAFLGCSEKCKID